MEAQKAIGAARLDAWCEGERGRAARLAVVLGVDESTVSRWRSGASAPGGPARVMLTRATDGAVPLDGWDVRDPADGPVVVRDGYEQPAPEET